MSPSRKLISSRGAHSLIKFQCQEFCTKKPTCDMIGPPDPVSNLHPIKYVVPENETPAEQKLRNSREELQTWNIVFWTKHNKNFIKQKKEFERKELVKKSADDQVLNANEMSVFYKKFLDDNWKNHFMYLLEWYKRNFSTTYLHLKVNILKLFKQR